jgi:ribosomal protein S27AE
VRRVTPYVTLRGLGAETAKAGCSRCQACSPMAAIQDRLQIGPKPGVTRG